MNVQVGDRVKGGAILATIHSHIVHDAWAGYFKALAERRRAENELRYGQAAEERAVRLLADKALSPQEVDRVRSDRIAAEQLLRGARAEETRATQELAHYGIVAREDGNPLVEDVVPIQAPFAAALIERQVSAGTAVTPGTPLFVLSDLSSLWVTAEVEEALVARHQAGLPVEVQVTAYPGEIFRGTLAAVGDVVNPATRRVTIRCELQQPGWTPQAADVRAGHAHLRDASTDPRHSRPARSRRWKARPSSSRGTRPAISGDRSSSGRRSRASSRSSAAPTKTTRSRCRARSSSSPRC